MQEHIVNEVMYQLWPFLTGHPGEVREALTRVLEKYDFTERAEPGSGVDAAIVEFVEAKRADGRSQKTLELYANALNSFRAQIGKDHIGWITQGDIRGYILYLSTVRTVKESSITTYINVLSSFFTWLSEEEKIPKNPMLRIHAPKIDRLKGIKSLTEEKLEKLRRACLSIRERLILEMYVSSGCRLSELAGLELEDVNMPSRTALILGKGGKCRTVYFSTKAKLLLEEYLHMRKGERRALFLSQKSPYAPLLPNTIAKIVKGIGNRAGIRIHTHMLRHTFAVSGIEDGVNLLAMKDLLGHESVETTQIYARVSDAYVRSEYNKFIK